MKRWIAGALMAALTAGLLVGVDAQSGATANVEVRVWQRASEVSRKQRPRR